MALERIPRAIHVMSNSPSQTLRREIGVFSATMMGLGAIVGTGIFVGIGHAAGVAGKWVVLAIALAAIVACFNGLSSAQLAAAHPVNGGTYEYGYRWLHPSLGFTAGWMFLCAKSASGATAALGLVGYSLRLFGLESSGLQVPLAIVAVALVTALLLAGIRWSSLINSVIVSITLATLLMFIVSGIITLLLSPAEILSPAERGASSIPITPNFSTSGFLEACALMFVAYTGYGRIATLGEEIRNPRRNIPIAILVTLAISMLLYVSVAWVAIAVVGSEILSDAARSQSAPLESVAQKFYIPETSYLIGIGAITSMIGVLNNLVLGLSRVALAMGRRGDLPRFFSRLDSSGSTPTAAVIGVGMLIAGLVIIGNVKTTWSFSAFSVLIYYAITNIAALRMSDEERRIPRILAWLGLASCIFLAFWVDLKIWMAGLLLIALGLCWWRAAIYFQSPLQRD